jgi:DNA-binding NarL/FixJ family response regulator
MKRPRIVIADDHVLIAQALEHLLQVEFDVVGVVSDGRALLTAAVELKPDVVVVDIGMPLLNGLDAGEQLKALHSEIKVIYLTQNREPRLAVEAFRRKASGYLLKDSAASELTTAIRQALQGRSYVSPLIAREMLDRASTAFAGDTGGRELSSREREVLQLLAEGKSMKEVAALLEISPRTVEFHKYRIMGLLGVKTMRSSCSTRSNGASSFPEELPPSVSGQSAEVRVVFRQPQVDAELFCQFLSFRDRKIVTGAQNGRARGNNAHVVLDDGSRF